MAKEEIENDAESHKAVAAAVRQAKRETKPTKIKKFHDKSTNSSSNGPSKKKQKTGTFSEDKTEKKQSKNEGERAKPGAGIGRSIKKPKSKSRK